jgi:hypothetical protein
MKSTSRPAIQRPGQPLPILIERWTSTDNGGTAECRAHQLDPRHIQVAMFAKARHDQEQHFAGDRRLYAARRRPEQDARIAT